MFSEDNLENKRLYIEEYYKLYNLMGGDSKGISKNSLRTCLNKAYNFYNNNENNQSEIASIKEVNEIFQLLSTDNINSEYLSINDFINIMTSFEFGSLNEDFDFFNN